MPAARAAWMPRVETLAMEWTLEPVGRLLVGALLGALVGAERELHNKSAGVRTNSLIALGAALFTIIGQQMAGPSSDPARVAGQVVTGVGFLGAGAILRTGASVHGMTTAATIWMVAAIGTAAGAGRLGLAVLSTVTTLVVLVTLIPVDRALDARHSRQAHR